MLRTARSVPSVRLWSAVAALSLGAFTPVAARAQVGHLPSNSPYEDVKVGQDFTVFLGRFNTTVGPAGVLPRSSLFGGLRYDVPIGGPGYFTARYTMIPSERDVVIPGKPRSSRVLSTENTRTNVMDVGFTLALPGRKSWHGFVPALSAGGGLAWEGMPSDTGGYKFGTKFAFTGGMNVKYMLGANWAVRADVTNYFWRNAYPDAYFIAASDTSRVLPLSVKPKAWGRTWGWSLGLVIPAFR
jgi:hypothetical protein